jgi:hypothetical protein
MNVEHFTLGESLPYVHSTYLSTLNVGDGPIFDHPGSYTVSNDGKSIAFSLYHGRKAPDQDMDDWGFDGPTLHCLTVAHDQDRILLQDADAHSLELAKRLGLEVASDTITLHYFADLVTVPRFADDAPAYFGDHSAYSQ